jgi:osmotically-inducible protein OsmY
MERPKNLSTVIFALVVMSAVFIVPGITLAQAVVDRSRPLAFAAPSDRATRRAIQQVIAQDRRLRSPIGVQVANGEVTLTGVVNSQEEKLAAEEDAANVGVGAVRNLLAVQPREPYSDLGVAERVRAALSRNPHVDPEQIHFSVADGTVHLTGIVESQFERLRTEYAVYPVDGVFTVINDLKVAPEGTLQRDERIKRHIERALRTSPMLYGHPVDVSIERGIVTLAGIVHTWEEREQAADHAYEAGAVSVRNNLLVRYPYDLGRPIEQTQ